MAELDLQAVQDGYNVPPGSIVNFSCKYIRLYKDISEVLILCMKAVRVDNRLTPIAHCPPLVVGGNSFFLGILLVEYFSTHSRGS